MQNKVLNKKWQLSKISKNIPIFELIYEWKKILIKEAKLRKSATKNLTCFKDWYFTLLHAYEINTKILVINDQFKSVERKSDEQKDWLHEKSRVTEEINQIYDDDKLPIIKKMFLDNKNKILRFLKNKELAKYKTKIEIDWYQGAEHNLNEQNQFVDDQIGGIGALTDIYDALFEDKVFDRVYTSNGKEIKKAKWDDLATSNDENVRKTSYAAYYTVERKHRYTLTSICYYIFKRMHQLSKLRNYENEIEWKAKRQFNISLKEYWYIIDQCVKYAPLNLKWEKLHNRIVKNAFSLNEINPWDRSIELNNIKEQITIPQAEQLVLDSLACCGKEFVENIKNVYKKKIINWQTADNESLNGFCLSGSPSLDEYPINIKWDGSVSGAITLSHELGHNLKTFYCKQNNEINNNTDIINAEISSIINEYITLFFLLEKYRQQNNMSYAYGIYKIIFSYFFHNVSECGYLSEFRGAFVYHCLSNKDVDEDAIEKLYLDCKYKFYGITKADYKKYYSKPIYMNEKYRAYSAYIRQEDHFRWNSLGYFIGSIVGIVVGWKIYNGDQQTLSNYFKFLKAGNNKKPINVIKNLGIDILKPQIYTEAKKLINDLLNQFNRDIKIARPESNKNK